MQLAFLVLFGLQKAIVWDHQLQYTISYHVAFSEWTLDLSKKKKLFSMSSNTFRCCLKFQYFSLTIVINRLVNAILVQSPRKKLQQNHYKI